MVNILIDEAQTEQATPLPFERGTRYVIRVRKREGLTNLSPVYYPRYIFRHLQRTALEDTSIVQIDTPTALLLFTSHIHPVDADAIREGWKVFPDVEMYPIVEDVEQGNPYRGTPCVRIFTNRKTTRPPRVAKYFSHYRWVVFEKVGGEKHGVFISEEAPYYTAERASDAFLITASDEEDSIRYEDLTGYKTWYTIPLSHTCL